MASNACPKSQFGGPFEVWAFEWKSKMLMKIASRDHNTWGECIIICEVPVDIFANWKKNKIFWRFQPLNDQDLHNTWSDGIFEGFQVWRSYQLVTISLHQGVIMRELTPLLFKVKATLPSFNQDLGIHVYQM